MWTEHPGRASCRITASTTGERWHEYFPAGGVEMGDSDAGHLD